MPSSLWISKTPFLRRWIPYISWSTDTIPEKESTAFSTPPHLTGGKKEDPEKVLESPTVSQSPRHGRKTTTCQALGYHHSECSQQPHEADKS